MNDQFERTASLIHSFDGDSTLHRRFPADNKRCEDTTLCVSNSLYPNVIHRML
jgi:hypothetical protein